MLKFSALEKFDVLFFVLIIVLMLLLALSVRSQEPVESIQPAEIVASGGSFALVKSVMAGGGTKKSGAAFEENGTTGQSIAGVKSSSGQFSLYSGFWTPDDFSPTAADLTVSGKIKTTDGAGIRNVKVTMQFATGESREIFSDDTGFYQFTEISVGGICIISVSAKNFTFAESTKIIQPLSDVQDVDFIGVRKSRPYFQSLN